MRRLTFPSLISVSAALLVFAGCKNLEKPVLARTDAQIAGDIQAKLASDKAFSSPDSPDIHVAVANGVATLTGQATDDNARLQAGADASQVNGVKQVVNDLTVPSGEMAEACLPPSPAHHARLRVKAKRSHAPALESAYVPPAPPAPAPPAYAAAPAYPPAPAYPAPAYVVPPAPVVVPVRPLYYSYPRGYWPRRVRPYPYRPGVGVYIHP